MEQGVEQKKRIKWWMAGCLVAVAVTIDLIQLLLTLVVVGAVISPIITIGATMLFWTWYKMLGISFVTNPKQIATLTTQFFGELIPVVDVLPLWTIGTIVTIVITNSEDKGGLLGKVTSIADSATHFTSVKKV